MLGSVFNMLQLAHITAYVILQCNHTTSLRALHAGLFEPPIKIAVMGSGCSVATEPTAEISHLYNLTQVSNTASVRMYKSGNNNTCTCRMIKILYEFCKNKLSYVLPIIMKH